MYCTSFSTIFFLKTEKNIFVGRTHREINLLFIYLFIYWNCFVFSVKSGWFFFSRVWCACLLLLHSCAWVAIVIITHAHEGKKKHTTFVTIILLLLLFFPRGTSPPIPLFSQSKQHHCRLLLAGMHLQHSTDGCLSRRRGAGRGSVANGRRTRTRGGGGRALVCGPVRTSAARPPFFV